MTARFLLPGLLAAALTMQLPACSFSGSVDTMLTPPRLTEEQEQIYQAMQSAVGNQISLKCPKSGERLSAFTVADLDADGSDEAIVFYQAARGTAEENRLRIGLLVQENGRWRAVREYPAAGAEIERVDICPLGANPRTNVIIQYSMVDGAEHAAEIFHYEDGQLQQTLAFPYSSMALRDLDGNGTRELFVTAAAKAPISAMASVYALDAAGSYVQSQVHLPESVTDVSRLAYGSIPGRDGTAETALYLDCVSGATSAQTAVLQYKNAMLSVLYADSADRYPNTNRPAGCQCMDVDGDGEVEIPVNSIFYGYSMAAEASPLSMTSWYVCRNGLLIRKQASYYSVQNKYIFVIPTRWEKQVTAVTEDEEIVFYTFATGADGAPLLQEQLLRLAVVSDALAADGLAAEGYTLLREQNGSYYMGAIRGESRLRLSPSELLFALKVL